MFMVNYLTLEVKYETEKCSIESGNNKKCVKYIIKCIGICKR